MPIYAYRCSQCGHTKDALQKMSDAPLTTCPACGQETLSKQVTAAGFALKGSGWYVTDFRGGSSGESSSTIGAENSVSPKSTASTDSSNSATTSTPVASNPTSTT